MSASRTDRRFVRAVEASAEVARGGEPTQADEVVGERAAESVTVRLVENAAWVQAVLTTVGRATNLGFAQAAVHIDGAGPIALGLARRLRGFGARVTLHSADPVALLAVSLEGFDTTVDDAISSLALFVFATEEAAPFDATRLGTDGRTVVVVDAARPGAAAAVAVTSSAVELRPGLVPVTTSGREAVLLTVADLRDDEYDRAAADVRAAFARHLPAQTESPGDDTEPFLAADATLAKALLP